MIVPASKYLLGILNSKLADYYIRQLGVTRNGGYFEYKPMFFEKLPVPQLQTDSLIYKEIEELVGRAQYSDVDTAVFDAYNLTEEERRYILE